MVHGSNVSNSNVDINLNPVPLSVKASTYIFALFSFFCSSPRLGRSSRSSALGSRFRDSPSSSYSIKNTADIYKKYPGSTSPLESPLLARSRKTSIVDSYLNCEKKEEACDDNSHEVIDYKELYEKEKREKEVSSNTNTSLWLVNPDHVT